MPDLRRASEEGSGSEARGASEKISDLADRRFAEHQHQHAREAHAEAAVRRNAVAEEVEVELQVLRVEPLLLRLLDQDVDPVLALRARGDLDAVVQQVVALREP